MPNFQFTRDTPFATHNPSSDQPIMQTNTNSEDSIWTVDHFGFNDNNGGLHKQVHLKNEAAPGLGGLDGVFYANLANGQSWPFWQNALGSFQMIGRNVIGANGYITLPSPTPNPIIIQWGSTTAVQNSSTTAVSFPLVFPTAVFTVVTSIVTDDNSTIRFSLLNNASSSGFTTTQTNTSHFTRLYWLAIGN